MSFREVAESIDGFRENPKREAVLGAYFGARVSFKQWKLVPATAELWFDDRTHTLKWFSLKFVDVDAAFAPGLPLMLARELSDRYGEPKPICGSLGCIYEWRNAVDIVQMMPLRTDGQLKELVLAYRQAQPARSTTR